MLTNAGFVMSEGVSQLTTVRALLSGDGCWYFITMEIPCNFL